ncbi:DNA damage-binding protein 2 [Halotydeus destructor]|nr:DNA damage-binding protein 2 [Halotydeus destructor]
MGKDGDSVSSRKVVKAKRVAKEKENKPLKVDHVKVKKEKGVTDPVNLDDVNERLRNSRGRRTSLSLLTHQYHRSSQGQYKSSFKTQVVKELLIPNLTSVQLSLYHVDSPRIMSLEWHPRIPHLLLVGGKHGEILSISDFEMSLPNTDKMAGTKNVQILDACGPAGGLTTIRFDPVLDDVYYSTSISGEVSRATLDSKVNQSIFQTHRTSGKCLDHWFTGLDVHPSNKMLYVGDNKGNLHIMPQNGGEDFDFHRLHKSKIHCVDIHPRNHNILATSSVDYSVKIWDIRKLKVESPLEILKFEGVINSGFFSRQDGGKFVSLSSQKKGAIQIFSSTNWKQLHSIDHSADVFQHLTPIKATWHPLADVIVVGKYQAGKKENSNAVDFFDAESGERIHQIESTDHVGIKSLNVFNCSGDTLATAMGKNVIVWKQQSFVDHLSEKIAKARRQGRLPDFKDHRGDDNDDTHRPNSKRKKATKKEPKTKKKSVA